MTPYSWTRAGQLLNPVWYIISQPISWSGEKEEKGSMREEIG